MRYIHVYICIYMCVYVYTYTYVYIMADLSDACIYDGVPAAISAKSGPMWMHLRPKQRIGFAFAFCRSCEYTSKTKHPLRTRKGVHECAHIHTGAQRQSVKVYEHTSAGYAFPNEFARLPLVCRPYVALHLYIHIYTLHSWYIYAHNVNMCIYTYILESSDALRAALFHSMQCAHCTQSIQPIHCVQRKHRTPYIHCTHCIDCVPRIH